MLAHASVEFGEVFRHPVHESMFRLSYILVSKNKKGKTFAWLHLIRMERPHSPPAQSECVIQSYSPCLKIIYTDFEPIKNSTFLCRQAEFRASIFGYTKEGNADDWDISNNTGNYSLAARC